MKVLYDFRCELCDELTVDFWDNQDPEKEKATITCKCGSTARWCYPAPKNFLNNENIAIRKIQSLNQAALDRDRDLKRGRFGPQETTRRGPDFEGTGASESSESFEE